MGQMFSSVFSRVRHSNNNPVSIYVHAQTADGRCLLIPITDTDTVNDVMKKVRRTAKEAAHTINVLKPVQNLFWYQHVYIAVPQGTEPTHNRSPGRIRDIDESTERMMQNFMSQYPTVIGVVGDVANNRGAIHCVRIETRLKLVNIFILASIAVIVAVVAGVLVGVFSRNIGFGVATTASVVGGVAFLTQLFLLVVVRCEVIRRGERAN